MISLIPITPASNETSQPQTIAPSSRRTPRGLSQNSDGVSVSSFRSWFRQLLAVDFRHAFWPWAAYLFALFMMCYGAINWQRETHPHYVWNSWAVALAGFAAPAVAVRIFCTDFDNGTAARLLSTPVKRGSIWFARLAFCAALLLVPAIITHLALPEMSWKYLIGDGVGPRPFTMGIIYLAWCAWAFGPLISLLLRRSILAWTATVIMPLMVAVVAAIISSMMGHDPGSVELFPYLPAPILLTGLCLGIAAQAYAAYLWKHFEVRQ